MKMRQRSASRVLRKPPRIPADYRRPAACLKQISDPIRLRVILALGEHALSVGVLRAEIGCSMTALSRHLGLLRLANLVESRRDGQKNVYSLTDLGRSLGFLVGQLVT